MALLFVLIFIFQAYGHQSELSFQTNGIYLKDPLEIVPGAYPQNIHIGEFCDPLQIIFHDDGTAHCFTRGVTAEVEFNWSITGGGSLVNMTIRTGWGTMAVAPNNRLYYATVPLIFYPRKEPQPGTLFFPANPRKYQDLVFGLGYQGDNSFIVGKKCSWMGIKWEVMKSEIVDYFGVSLHRIEFEEFVQNRLFKVQISIFPSDPDLLVQVQIFMATEGPDPAWVLSFPATNDQNVWDEWYLTDSLL